MLVCYYFVKNEVQYGVITLTIIVVPAVLCQIYSLWLLRSDSTVSARALMMHILLLGIPYRYQNILHKISRKDKSMAEDEEHTIELIVDRIRDVNAIQTVNAIFQYCPQFLFQSFLIVYRHYKYLMTGKLHFHLKCRQDKTKKKNKKLLLFCRCFSWSGMFFIPMAYFYSFFLLNSTL